MAVGLAIVAPTVVDTFFDARWSYVGVMLMCLSAISVARPLTCILAGYFYASGRPGTVLSIECATLVGLVAALSTVGRIGISWACICVSVVFIARTLGGMWIVRRQDGIVMSEFLLPMAGPAAACVAMVVAVIVVRLTLGELPPALRLLVEVVLGAAVFMGCARLLARSSWDELGRLFRASLGLGPTERGSGLRLVSLSTEFPNPSEPGKGLFVRARLAAMASGTQLSVVAPVASLDYANPGRNLFAARRIPRARTEGRMPVLHPRWLYPPHGGWTNAFFLFVRLLPLITRLRIRRACDVIDAHFAHPEGIAAVLLGKIVGCAVFVTIRGSELRYRNQPWKRFWMSWALRRADRVIAVSEGLRELALELGVDPRRVKTVPNGIDSELFVRRDRGHCRSAHGIAPDERVILSAGDLAQLKGHHRVIAAVQELNAHGVRARLLIAGGIGRSGRYAEALLEQVTANGLDGQVAFLGEVPQARLAELMCAADVFCLASSTEGWPNVVNEALACGTPVVATDVGAVRQMVAGDAYGYVIAVNDADALASALRAALTRTWDNDGISAWGRLRSWSQVAEEVLAEMRTVVAERRRRSVELHAQPRRAAYRVSVRTVAARLSGLRLF
jgi:glycosyltransferase involved in cell wall biosynthesis